MNEWCKELLRSRWFYQAFPGRPCSSPGIMQPVILSLNCGLGRKWGSYLNKHGLECWTGSKAFAQGTTLVPTQMPLSESPGFYFHLRVTKLLILSFYHHVFSWSTGAKICPLSYRRPADTFWAVSFKWISNKFLFNLSPEYPHDFKQMWSLCNT